MRKASSEFQSKKPYASPNSIENDAHGKFYLSLETYFCPWIPEPN